MATDLIDSYAAYLRSESRSDRTINERRRTLGALDRELPYGLESACADELITWLWREGLSIGSRETYYGAIHGFFTWASETGVLDWDPTEHITRPRAPARLPRPCTDDQLAELLTRADAPYRTWCLLAAYGGLRCIEISRLSREHITQRVMTLRGKGGKPRYVPTHPDIWNAVCDLPSGPITDRSARDISVRTVTYFQRKLGMQGVSMHRLRHWFGTNVQRLHRDLRVTQQLMGHASPATTAGYALVADEDAAHAVNLLPSLTVATAAAASDSPERAFR